MRNSANPEVEAPGVIIDIIAPERNCEQVQPRYDQLNYNSRMVGVPRQHVFVGKHKYKFRQNLIKNLPLPLEDFFWAAVLATSFGCAKNPREPLHLWRLAPVDSYLAGASSAYNLT